MKARSLGSRNGGLLYFTVVDRPQFRSGGDDDLPRPELISKNDARSTVGLLGGEKSLHCRCHDLARARGVSKFHQANARGHDGAEVISTTEVVQVMSADLEAQEWNGGQACHVPKLSSPLVIGIEIVEPRREAFMWETLSCHGYKVLFELQI